MCEKRHGLAPSFPWHCPQHAAKAPPSLGPLPPFQRPTQGSRGNDMKKYLVAAVLVASFATPALAEQFWVAYDGKRCEMFSHKPKDSMNILGTYDSRHDAEKANEEDESVPERLIGWRFAADQPRPAPLGATLGAARRKGVTFYHSKMFLPEDLHPNLP